MGRYFQFDLGRMFGSVLLLSIALALWRVGMDHDDVRVITFGTALGYVAAAIGNLFGKPSWALVPFVLIFGSIVLIILFGG
jgi:hypothetical protein